MENIIQDEMIVNTDEEINNINSEDLLDESENKEVKLNETEQIELLTQKLNAKGTPSIEYIYINQKNSKGMKITENYRKQSGKLFYWTNEYWQETDFDDIKKNIASWLHSKYPSKLSAKSISSIFNVFFYSIEVLKANISKELIIPTRKYWLSINEITGVITAIKPNKDISITYQINMIVNKLGLYTPKKLNEKSLLGKFINSALKDTIDRSMVHQYCGLTFTNTTRKQICQMWIGEGSNGKSTLISILAHYHRKAVSTKMDTIGKYNDKFIGSSLIFATELNKGTFDQEFFKSAVAGDIVEVRGIYGTPQNTVLTAKWILLGNDYPLIDDHSDGVYRRIQIVKWPENFKNSPDKVEDLANKIIESEGESFMDWCLLGLQDLIRNNWNFPKSLKSESALEDLKMRNDKIKFFCHELNVKHDPLHTKTISKEFLFEEFNKWSCKNNFAQVNVTTFWKRMNQIFPEFQKDSADIKRNGKRVVYFYFGVDEIISEDKFPEKQTDTKVTKIIPSLPGVPGAALNPVKQSVAPRTQVPLESVRNPFGESKTAIKEVPKSPMKFGLTRK